MDHSIHTYLRQAKERTTNEPLSTVVNPAGKTQDFYILQSYMTGKFAAIIATLNSFAASTYVTDKKPVLFASRTFDILTGDPENPVYVDMDVQAADHVAATPNSFTIGQTAAGKYLTKNDLEIIDEAIGDLNATLTANGLSKLTRGQVWTVQQAVWAVASENMVNAVLDANPDAKFRVFAGTGMDDGSILLINEVSRIVQRNRASINGETPSAFSSEPAAALLDSTTKLNGIYGARGIIVPPHKDSSLRHIFACHPERGEQSHRLSNAGILVCAEDDMNITRPASGPPASDSRIIRTTADMPPVSTSVAAKTAFASAAMIIAELKDIWDSALAASGGRETRLWQSGPPQMCPQILLT